jgi:hypothetical protein
MQSSITLLITLLAWNSLTTFGGHRTTGLAVDLFLVVLAGGLLVATRIWPDKIWIRRPE